MKIKNIAIAVGVLLSLLTFALMLRWVNKEAQKENSAKAGSRTLAVASATTPGAKTSGSGPSATPRRAISPAPRATPTPSVSRTPPLAPSPTPTPSRAAPAGPTHPAGSSAFNAEQLHRDEKDAGKLFKELKRSKLGFNANRSFDLMATIRAKRANGATDEQILTIKKRYAANVAKYLDLLRRAKRLMAARSISSANYFVAAWSRAGRDANLAGDRLGQRAKFAAALRGDQRLQRLMQASEPIQEGALPTCRRVA